MQIKWKILCSFGLLFWSTMCVIDYGFGNIINKGEFSKTNFDEDDEEDLGPLAWKQVATWGMLSFIASFLMCVFMKIFKQIMYKLSQDSISITDVNQSSHATIELRETAKNSGLCIKFEPAVAEKDNTAIPNLNLLEAVKDFPVTTQDTSTSEITTKLVEKRCAKLKEEMREMQMNTWKEYSNLNKKLDTLTKEKFDMGKQIIQLQKDNKGLKHQLEEITTDRALLIKRLEVATKEIKLNTTAKQMTLDKLEEAVSCTTQMKAKVSQLTEEKKSLEAKCKDLQDKYGMLKEQVRINLDNKIMDEIKCKELKTELEMEQSEKDIEKVQNKLMDLEKSLKKMSLKSSKEVCQVDGNNNLPPENNELRKDNDTKHTELSDDDNYQPGEYHNITSKNPNGSKFEDKTMDEMKGESSDSDEKNPGGMRNIALQGDEDLETDTVNFWHSSIGTRTISTTNSDITTVSQRSEEDSAISVEESESETMFPPGIVSQSPAFQKFLLKVLESPVV